MSWTNIFGGGVIKPSNSQYQALTFGGDTQLYWPLETIQNVPYVAAAIDGDATTTGLALIMPDATTGSTGVAAIITNVGTNSFNMVKADGTTSIITVAAGVSWVLILTDNTTTNGTWEAIQLGATTSSGQASQLAGAGLQASGSLLRSNMPVQSLSTNTNLDQTYRANAVVWTGGAGTLTITNPATLGAGWWAWVVNEGSAALTLSPAAGTIAGAASLSIPVGTTGQYYSGLIVSDGTNLHAFGVTPNVIAVAHGGTGATTATQALTNLGGTATGISIFEAPNAAAVLAILGISSNPFVESTVSTGQNVNAGSIGTAFVATAPLTLTLAITTGLTNNFYFYVNALGGAVTLAPNTADAVNGGSAGSNFVIQEGTTSLVFTDANGNWYTAPQAVQSIGNPGYIKYQNGLIFQWGVANLSAVTTLTITYPIPFPTQTIGIYANVQQSAGSASAYANVYPTSNSQAELNTNSSGFSVNWLALGF